MTDPETHTHDPGNPPFPLAAMDEALREFLELAVEGQGNLPPGLEIRVRDDIGLLEVLSRGRVIATIVRSALLERAGVIAAERN